MYCRVKGFNSSAEHFGNACQLFNGGNIQSSVSEGVGSAATCDQFPADFDQRRCKFDEIGFVVNTD